jgi:tRNA-specific 2-thiouridylase
MNIAVLASGGVDSSVALRLLQEQGHTITAFYLKIWLEDELAFLGECPWEDDLAYVRTICHDMQIPLEIVPMQGAYRDRIVSYVIDEVKAGRTPNPDVLCNQFIKFGAFFDAVKDRCFDKVATGHYARVEERDGLFHLIAAPDLVKDQTYFLSQLSQQQLAKIIFPLGHLIKEQVRAEAQRFDLPNKDRKDSQGICFLGKLKFSEFIRHHVGDQVGPLVEIETGNKMGEHQGFWYYTIGQRQGIGLSGGPWYVVAKDHEKNIVFISREYYSQEKERDQFMLGSVNWITGYAPEKSDLEVKLRHGAYRHPCTLVKNSEGRWLVTLKERDQGIAPGQFAVFYDGQECLGAGAIELIG